MVKEKIVDIDKSEGLSGQILLLGREAECTGLPDALLGVISYRSGVRVGQWP